MNSGFLVVLLVAALLVVAPSMLAITGAWRRGGVYRAGAALALIAIFGLAGLFLMPSDWPNTYEERAVLFLATWSMVLAVATVPYLLFVLGQLIYQQLHRT